MELEMTDPRLLAAARSALDPRFAGPVTLYYLTKVKIFRVCSWQEQIDLPVEEMMALYQAAVAPEAPSDKPEPPRA